MESGGHPLYEISSTVRNPKQCLYISAGIHGDEPAGVWGLFDWFEKNIEQLTDVNFLIYPCLNPWGLVNNTRTDFEGRDMNRAWSDNSHPVIGNVIERLAGAHFRFAINLHEDFDADGIYLYDPPAGKKWIILPRQFCFQEVSIFRSIHEKKLMVGGQEMES